MTGIILIENVFSYLPNRTAQRQDKPMAVLRPGNAMLWLEHSKKIIFIDF